MAALVTANSSQPLLVTSSGRLSEDGVRGSDAGHLSLPSHSVGTAVAAAGTEQTFFDDGGSETNDSFKVSQRALQPDGGPTGPICPTADGEPYNGGMGFNNLC